MTDIEKFVLERNVERYERLLSQEGDSEMQRILIDLLDRARRDLRTIDADPPPVAPDRPRIR